MKSGIPWNLKRVDEDTRQAVIEAARRSGMSVGAWLNQVLAPEGQGYDEPENPQRAPDLETTMAQLRARLDDIERSLQPAPAERKQKSVPEMVADLAREIENPDERARSSVEGLRGRPAAPVVRAHSDADRFGDAIRALDRQIADMGKRIVQPTPPTESGQLPLDDIRHKLDALLAHTPKPDADAAPRRAAPAAAVEAALMALESRIDEAKAELGQRDPQAATGEQLARLEAQLADIHGRLASSDTDPHMRRREADLASAIREISAHQRTIDDRAETVALRRDQKALSAAVAALRADIAALGEQVSAIGRVGAEDQSAFFDLSRRIDALAAETPVDRNLMSIMRGDLETLRMTIEAGAREDALGAVFARTDGMAAQVNALLAGSPNRKQVEALGEEVAALRSILEADDSPRAIKRLEARIIEVGRTVEAVLTGQNAAAGPSPVLEQLEERLREISGRIETLREPGVPATVSAAIEAAQEQVELRLDDLASRLGGLFATMPRQSATLETIEQRLQGVVERIDGLSLTQYEPVRALDMIQAEIRALRAELAVRPEAPANTEHLEAQIRDLAGQLEVVASSTPDGAALAALERQVETLAGELEEARPRVAAVAELEQNLIRLQTLLADTTRESIVGARAEAQQAVTQLSELVAEYEIDSDLVRSLMRDLDALKSAAGSNDETTHVRLESVSRTLAEVVDRLGRLEHEALGAAGGHGSATLSIAAAPAVAGAEEAPAVAVPAPERGADRRADFIAAARRAAQAASARVAADELSPARAEAMAAAAVAASAEPARERKPGAFARISQAIRSRKRPLLLAAAAIVIAIGAMQVFGRLAMAPQADAIVSSAEVATVPIVRPAREVREVAAAVAAPEPQPATAPAAATPTSAIAFAEPESVESRFAPTADVPSGAGFGPQAAVTDGDGPAAAADVTLASATADQPAAGYYAAGLDPRIGDDRLLRAADDGDPIAAFEVARRYAEGTRVPKNLAKAADWYRRAAEGGVAVAQYRLASLYERGQGVARSRVDAVNWYQRAADQGNVNAMHNLAVMMSEGVEGPPDQDKAMQWFLAAGNYGVRDSQYNLGVIYARGLGPEQDLVESYKWFSIAAVGGDTDAAVRRGEVGKAMSREELAAADAAIAAWHVQPGLAEANGVTAPAGGWDGPGDGFAQADREALVRKIQILLAEQGYDPGPADGVAGPKTVEAVRLYQQRIGQPATGQIDSTLIAALDNGAT